jgi:signal transduction histidine kinase
VAVHVTLESRRDDDLSLHFVVSDTGIGIDKNKQDAIFRPFVQADISMTRKYGGTGLGLSICSHLVQLMEGSIWVESQLGEGSAFHFTAHFGVPAVERDTQNKEALVEPVTRES